MTESRLWILGAPDPEMEAIEALLRECGERVIHAKLPSGERIRSGQFGAPVHIGDASTVYTVECDLPLAYGEPEHEPDVGQVIIDGRRYMSARHSALRIDHHAPGDPGYGRPPSEFLAASSVGQVIAELARLGRLPEDWPRLGTSWGWTWQRGELVTRGGHPAQPGFPLGWWVTTREEGETGDASYGSDCGETAEVPRDLVLCAAADHCLGAAYRGECPGVDPDALMRWRVESRARFQGRPEAQLLADIEKARTVLRAAPELELAPGVRARDMRGVKVCELPEASARENLCFVADGLPGPDGRLKVVCQSGSHEQIRAFLEHWAPAQGLTDLYGDPARGFAGAYLADALP